MDDVRIYNRALSASEVQALYAITPPSDTTAPVISSVAASGVTTSGATVTWTTNESATHQVEYGTTASYGQQTAENATLMASHSQTLSGLSAGTLYHYRVKSKDAAGNIATSLDQTFTTTVTAAPDTQAPNAIANLAASGIQQTSATLSWSAPADLPGGGAAASYDLRYSQTPITPANFTSAVQAAGEPTPVTPGTSQTYILAGLAPSTTYHAVIVSKDAAGNASPISNVLSFTTAAASVPVSVSSTASPTSSGGASSSSGGGGGGGGGGSYTPPPVTPPTSAKAHGATNQIVLTWTNPKDADFVRVKIFRATAPIVGAASAWQQSGTLVYEGDKEEFTDTTGLLPNTAYHYGIFSINRALANSSVQTLSTRLGEKTDQQVIQAIANEKNKPKPSSSGLSASQIQSILDVLASFNADADVIEKVKASLQGITTGSPTSTAVRVFKTDLASGSLGSDVKALQQFLNAHGYTVATSGAGSLGNETTRFGPATKAALIRYQKAKGITPAAGYFGAKTRAAVSVE